MALILLNITVFLFPSKSPVFSRLSGSFFAEPLKALIFVIGISYGINRVLHPLRRHGPLNTQGWYSDCQTPRGTGTDQSEWTLSLEAVSWGPLLSQMLLPWLLDHCGLGVPREGPGSWGGVSRDAYLPTNTFLCNPAELSSNMCSSQAGAHPASTAWARAQL